MAFPAFCPAVHAEHFFAPAHEVYLVQRSSRATTRVVREVDGGEYWESAFRVGFDGVGCYAEAFALLRVAEAVQAEDRLRPGLRHPRILEGTIAKCGHHQQANIRPAPGTLTSAAISGRHTAQVVATHPASSLLAQAIFAFVVQDHGQVQLVVPAGREGDVSPNQFLHAKTSDLTQPRELDEVEVAQLSVLRMRHARLQYAWHVADRDRASQFTLVHLTCRLEVAVRVAMPKRFALFFVDHSEGFVCDHGVALIAHGTVALDGVVIQVGGEQLDATTLHADDGAQLRSGHHQGAQGVWQSMIFPHWVEESGDIDLHDPLAIRYGHRRLVVVLRRIENRDFHVVKLRCDNKNCTQMKLSPSH